MPRTELLCEKPIIFYGLTPCSFKINRLKLTKHVSINKSIRGLDEKKKIEQVNSKNSLNIQGFLKKQW